MTIADIRPALRAYLLADSDISTRVGGVRVYPVKMPEGINTASIVYNRISGMGDHHMGGASGLARPRFQIDCWAPTADAATVLANLVKNRIDGFGPDPWPYGSNSPQDTIAVQGVFFDTERDLYDDVMKLYGVSRDYFIWHAER